MAYIAIYLLARLSRAAFPHLITVGAAFFFFLQLGLEHIENAHWWSRTREGVQSDSPLTKVSGFWQAAGCCSLVGQGKADMKGAL